MVSPEKVFTLLNKRESARMELSRKLSFYSVKQSLLNRHSNRYSNILAYDRTAVTIDGQYLNANVVVDNPKDWWIACQAPLPETFDTFFRAITTRSASAQLGITTPVDSAILVQLTAWEERGMPKADNYLESRASTRHPEISSDVTEIEIDHMKIRHYYFNAWPDHGIPQGEAIEALRRLVVEVEGKRTATGCEVWVHCSAGVGRTGTFIALASLLSNRPKSVVESPLGELPLKDTIAETVDRIREYRGGMVQTMEQFRLLYDMMS